MIGSGMPNSQRRMPLPIMVLARRLLRTACVAKGFLAGPPRAGSHQRRSGADAARSLRIVVAATPPCPIALLIWSSPSTTSPAA